MQQLHLFPHSSTAVHPRHKRFRLVQVDSDILPHGCTSWLRVVPSSWSEHRGAPAPLWSIETALYLSLVGAAFFHLIRSCGVHRLIRLNGPYAKISDAVHAATSTRTSGWRSAIFKSCFAAPDGLPRLCSHCVRVRFATPNAAGNSA